MFANIVIHFGLFLARKFNSKYQIIEYAVELTSVLISVLACGYVFEWFRSIPLRIMVIMVISKQYQTIVSVALIMSLSGKDYISNGYSSKLIIVTVLLSLLGCIGEEIGWRGFMLPAFNKKYSLFNSAVFTGILWGAWHFGKLMSYGILGYILFIVLITEFSIVMAWIYLKSNANMMCMVSFHLGINIASMFLLTGREGIMFYITACIISAFVCFVFVFTSRKKIFVNS